MSPDASKIMALPESRHPSLRATAERLATNGKVRLADALEILEATCVTLNIGRLDIEALDIEALPFAAATSATSNYEEEVRGHLARIMSKSSV